MFGYKQTGYPAVEAINVFHPSVCTTFVAVIGVVCMFRFVKNNIFVCQCYSHGLRIYL